MDFEQLGMDLDIPENEIEDAALDLDYNPEEQEDDGYDWIDSVEDFYKGELENDAD